MNTRWIMAGVVWLSGAAIAEPVVERPSGEPLLRAEDDLAIVEAWADLPQGSLDLLDRFEAVVEVRADAGVKIENWSIDDAFGDALLVTVIDAQELENLGDLGGWFGRYAVMVEPLVDGEVGFGPLRLSYLVDPDPESDPTQLVPTRTIIESDALQLIVRGPDGEIVSEPTDAKGAIEAERPFDWRPVLLGGAAAGVVLPTLAALVLAARTTRRRKRSEAPQRCEAELDALRRVVRAAEPSGLGVDSGAVSTEVMQSVRAMLDDAYGLRTRAMSGPEMVASERLRSVLSADAFDRLRVVVESTDGAKFAGDRFDAVEAKRVMDAASDLARAIASQRRAMV